jgi:hypothetical protein
MHDRPHKSDGKIAGELGSWPHGLSADEPVPENEHGKGRDRRFLTEQARGGT